MPRAKIAISLDDELLLQLDELVKQHVYASRSQAIQVAVSEKLTRLHKNRLARECAKLDPSEERAMAEEGMAGELGEWPEY